MSERRRAADEASRGGVAAPRGVTGSSQPLGSGGRFVVPALRRTGSIPRSRIVHLTLAAAAVAALAFGPGTATTEPAAIEAQRAEVAQIQQQLDSYGMQVEVAAEAYNGGALGARQGERADRRQPREAAATAEEARAPRASRCVAPAKRSTRRRSPASSRCSSTSGSITAIADQVDLLDRVGQQDAQVVGGLREQKAAWRSCGRSSSEDRETAEEAVEAREREKERIERLLAQRQAVLDSASEELRGLVAAEERRREQEAARQAEIARQRRRRRLPRPGTAVRRRPPLPRSSAPAAPSSRRLQLAGAPRRRTEREQPTAPARAPPGTPAPRRSR